MLGTELPARHRSLLMAVAQGRAQLTVSQYPCLCVDGRWCDQLAAGQLVRDGFVHAARAAQVGTLVPAVLTAAGAAVVATVSRAGQAAGLALGGLS